MTLVDTSVWIDFLRDGAESEGLESLLETNEILLHPWVLGELALGNPGSRMDRVCGDLRRLPAAPHVADDEVLDLISSRQLAGRGVGWVDVQLIASALVAASGFWTLDRSLASVVTDLGLPVDP